MVGLDIGCGKNKHPGYIGLDMTKYPGVDLVHTIRSGQPLPADNDFFDKVRMHDVIEHVPDISWLLSEVHRISKPNAEVEMQYPHYSGRNAHNDTTHIHLLGIRAFNHYMPDTKEGKKYQYYLQFNRNFPFALSEMKLVCRFNPLSQAVLKTIGNDLFEGYASGVLPISTVLLRMRVLKGN